MKRALQIAKPWLPAIAYMATIVVLSSQSAPPVSLDYVPLQDKGAHVIEYAILATLFSYALRTRHLEKGGAIAFGSAGKLTLQAIALTTLWGYLDELHQAFVPGRSSDVLDLLADFIGAIVGSAIYFAWKLAIARKRSTIAS